MAYDIGFDFRNTLGFVTDPANCTAILGTETYPTTRSIGALSVTFGFVTSWSPQTRDRNAANDPRVAGAVFNTNGTSQDFQVDLPNANAAVVHMGIGYDGGTFTLQADIRDATSSLFTVGPTSVPSTQFMDATGVVRTSSADWATNEAGKSISPANSTLLLRFAPSTTSIITHLRIVQAGGGGGRTFRLGTGLDGLSTSGPKQFNPTL